MYAFSWAMSNLDMIFKVPVPGGGSYPSVVFIGTKHRVESIGEGHDQHEQA